MKLVVAIVQEEDVGALVDACVRQEIAVTRLSTAGGFLKAENATILTAVEENRLETVLSTFETTCHTRRRLLTVVPSTMDMEMAIYLPDPIEIEVGGATVFVLDVETFTHL